MKFKAADVVVPINGRDEGKRFLVIGTQEEYSLLADGRNRRVEKPKKKKNKHLKPDGKANDQIAARLADGGKITNNEIRRLLAQYTVGNGEEGGM